MNNALRSRTIRFMEMVEARRERALAALSPAAPGEIPKPRPYRVLTFDVPNGSTIAQEAAFVDYAMNDAPEIIEGLLAENERLKAAIRDVDEYVDSEGMRLGPTLAAVLREMEADAA